MDPVGRFAEEIQREPRESPGAFERAFESILQNHFLPSEREDLLLWSGISEARERTASFHAQHPNHHAPLNNDLGHEVEQEELTSQPSQPNKRQNVFQSRFLSEEKVASLLNVLKQENARSLFLSCLPGEFKRSRVKLDLAHLEQPGRDHSLLSKMMAGGSYSVDLDTFDFDASLVLQKKFKSLLDQSRTEEKERGTNPLKIGYPIVTQEARQGTSNCFAAPLFIWDVKLEKGARNTWKIKFDKSIPTRNNSLEGITQGEYQLTNIDLGPAYHEVEEIADFEEFTGAFAQRIDAFMSANPTIVAEDAVGDLALSHIPFQKKGDLINAEAEPLKVSLLHSAMMGKFQQGKVSIIRDLEAQLQEMGDLSPGGVELTPLGGNASDPAQAAALIALKEPQHIVLHGPPGTGKSQTITSILTAALAKKKRVAVVCQKMVALEVIEGNLQELGISDGIAFITDPVKGRRKVIDAARARYESQNQSNLSGTGQMAANEERYKTLTKTIVQQKKKLSAPLNVTNATFSDCTGTVVKIQREVPPEELSIFVQRHPEPRQIHSWRAHRGDLAADIEQLQQRHERIKTLLPLAHLFTKEVMLIQVGMELPLLCNGLKTAMQLQEAIQAEERAIAEAIDLEQNKVKEKSEAITDFKAWATRQHATGHLVKRAMESLAGMPIKEWPKEWDSMQTQVQTLQREKSRIKAHPDYVSVIQYPGWTAWFKMAFSSRAKRLVTDNRTFESQLQKFGLQMEDDFDRFHSSIQAIQNDLAPRLASMAQMGLDDTLESMTRTCEEHRASLLSFRENISSEQPPIGMEGAKDQYHLACQQFDTHWTELTTGKNWVATAPLKSIVLEKDSDLLQRLEDQLGDIPTMMHWLEDIGGLALNVHDFELKSLPQWVQFHLVKSDVKGWNQMSALPMNDHDIHQMESVSKDLGRNVIVEAKRLLDEQFEEATTRIESHDTVYTFKQEFAKTGKRKKSLRQLYQRHGRNMTKLFPIHLLTPESMCNLFEAQDHVFDLIIFDEASQLKLEDGVSCLLKGNSIVVSGDEHQMPPSSYFASKRHVEDESDESDIGPEIDSESLLDFCQQLPGFQSKYLEFHYRSRHPLLIQFSNAAIYSRLVVKPNKHDYVPIRFIDVQGTWENRHNDKEAKKLIDLIMTMTFAPDVPAILVATLNTDQRNHILTTIEKEREINDAFARRMTQLEAKGFGVKNLENLQGDECDIVILSVGYGRTPEGKFKKLYGPINQKHGYRLLNVLVTRARHKMFVLNSIPMEETRMFLHEMGAGGSSWSRGLFHAYLNYARLISLEKREEALHVLDQIRQFNLEHRDQHVSSDFDEKFDSPFEEEVFFALRSRFEEHEIRSQEKALGFRMDFVVHPKEAPGLKIAVECDGAAFHEGWENQLSDFHREQLLKDSGYKFVRIWSRNWWTDARGETSKVIRTIERLIAKSITIEPRVPSFLDDTAIAQDLADATPDLPAIEALEQTSETVEEEIVEGQGATISTPDVDGNRLEEAEANAEADIEHDASSIVAPCVVNVSFLRSEERTHRFVFLESRGTSFLGKNRDHWMQDKSRDLTVLGDEHPTFALFVRRHVGDEFEFKGSPIRIDGIIVED